MISDLPTWLAGAWSIERAIDGGRGTYRGVADFAVRPDGSAAWLEEGRLRLDAYEGHATRELLVAPAAPWEVRFDDGRLFHPLDLSSGRCEVVHLCGPDTYAGVYEVLGDDDLAVRWHVRGAVKDSTIESRYRRTR